MSMNGSYLYTNQPRNQQNMDMMHGGNSGNVQLDFSSLNLTASSGHSSMVTSSSVAASRLQHHQIGMRSQPPQMSSMQQPQQKSSKKSKESMLKTPLSLLNELCSKAKTLPIFNLEETGPVHMRVYTCSVKVDTQGFSCEAVANGKTKKEAKQEAAKSLLLQMDKEAEKYLIPTVAKEEPIAPIIDVDPEIPGNPVGDLNDLCTKLKRLPPEYEDVAEVGKPHERVYTVACKLGSHIMETGRGRSKKAAKKSAASKVHKRVLDVLSKDSVDAGVILKEEDNIMEMLNNLTLVSKHEAKKINEGWKLTDWVNDMKSRSGPKIELIRKDAVQARMMNPDPMKFLKDIAEEQKFKLEFTELDHGNENLKSYLIGVSTGSQPITVLMGSAESKTQARKAAAEVVLEMIRTTLVSK